MLHTNKIQIISIEGNIGSGKSTLLEHLKTVIDSSQFQKVVFLKEPVDEWATIRDEHDVTMLEKFYQNQNQYSFAFQMMAYISRLNLLKKTVEAASKENGVCTLIISERSLFTDKQVFAKMLYDTGFMEFIQYQIYLKWFDAFSAEFPIHKIIYVKTSPEICYQRILKRSRSGEDQISHDYLNRSHLYHEEMLDPVSPDCVCKSQLILNGNVDLYENETQELQKWIHQIENFIQL